MTHKNLLFTTTGVSTKELMGLIYDAYKGITIKHQVLKITKTLTEFVKRFLILNLDSNLVENTLCY